MGSISRDEATVRTFDRTRQPERWGRIGDVGPVMSDYVVITNVSSLDTLLLILGTQANSTFAFPFSLPTRPKRRGPRDLASMCLFKLSSNFRLVDRESVYALPARYLAVLWRLVAGCKFNGFVSPGVSFHAWESVGGALINHRVQEERERLLRDAAQVAELDRYDGDQIPCLNMYRQFQVFVNSSNRLDCVFPNDSVLQTNFAILRRASLSCLVHLCLEDVERFERVELLALADLPLTVLEMVQYLQPECDTLLDDQLCRDWGRLAENAGGFAKLRLLRVTSKWHKISRDGLAYLRSFPQLLLVDINRRWRHRGVPPLSGPTPGWEPGILGRTLFETYASTYLGRRVYTSTKEVEDMTKMFEEYMSTVPVLPIPAQGVLRPVNAYFGLKAPPDGFEHDDDRLRKASVTEAFLRDPEGEESGPCPSFEEDIRYPPVIARPWEVCTWLGLVDYNSPDPEGSKIQLQAMNIPLPRRRYLHQQLADPCPDPPQWEAARLSRVVYRRYMDDDIADGGKKREPRTADNMETRRQITSEPSLANQGPRQAKLTEFFRRC
ncbi:hypothetical protein VTJ04DRAFT_7186 [Mycothermus thermophilus]|uniref:uncharacterized protein n=1 Tax=Humicola insolens TaxID=85995 RepID=UPI003743D65D